MTCLLGSEQGGEKNYDRPRRTERAERDRADPPGLEEDG
jgi:hypothetical protein